MIVFISAFVASFIPFIALYLWLRNRRGAEEDYKKLCDRTLLRGESRQTPGIYGTAGVITAMRTYV